MVAAVVRCPMGRLKKLLPHVTELTVVSDNAGCFNSNIIPVVLLYICYGAGLQLRTYLRGETRNGEGPVDAHFSRRFCRGRAREEEVGPGCEGIWTVGLRGMGRMEMGQVADGRNEFCEVWKGALTAVEVISILHWLL